MHLRPSTPTSPAAAEHDPVVVRARLDRRRRVRLRQLSDLSADTAEGIATADETRLKVNRVLAVVADAAVAEVDAALQRLETGVYGRCERCAETIVAERLAMLPTARLCTRCQYITEAGRADRGPCRHGCTDAGLR